MTASYDLIIDSPCELPRSMWDKEGIVMLNFTYTDGTTTRVDDLFETITPHDFYEPIRKGASMMTSQPSQAQYEKAFRAAAAAGRTAVYLAFSSGISGAYEGALAARERILEEYPEADLKVLDLLVGSTPQSLLIYEAIEKWESGMPAQELYDWAEEARWRAYTVCLVDDLETLRRGGRIPAGVSIAGAAIDLKLLMNFGVDGKLHALGVKCGRKKSMRYLADYFKKHRDPGESPLVAIGDADCPEDAEVIVEGVLKVAPDARIIRTKIGPTIGCHVGPNMLSCCFWGPDRRKS